MSTGSLDDLRTERPVTLHVAPPARRRPSMAVAGILLAVISALIAGTLLLRADHRSTVLVLAQPVPAGHQISAADLSTARVAATGVRTVPAASRSEVIGKFATADLLAGTLVSPAMLTAVAVPAAGQAIVGVAIKSSQLPANGLRAGDPVRVVRTPTNTAADTAPLVLSAHAVVYAVAVDDDTGVSTVSLLLPEADAPSVAQASAADELGLFLLPKGTG